MIDPKGAFLLITSISMLAIFFFLTCYGLAIILCSVFKYSHHPNLILLYSQHFSSTVVQQFHNFIGPYESMPVCNEGDGLDDLLTLMFSDLSLSQLETKQVPGLSQRRIISTAINWVLLTPPVLTLITDRFQLSCPIYQ